MTAILVATAPAALASVPVPEAGPPLGEKGIKLHHPQAGVGFDLGPFGYFEEERLVSGVATSTVEGQPPEPYSARVILRRPIDPARFNGTVVMEWFNVSVNHDIDVVWPATFGEVMREGYAYMTVSAQRPRTELKHWDPVRYEDVVHPGDRYAEDIFQQAGQLLKSRRQGAMLLGKPAEVLIATGQSQSAEKLHAYTKTIQDKSRVFDGFLIDRGREANGTIPFVSDPSVPTIFALTENEAMADQNNYGELARVWQTAGTGHVDNWGDTYAIRNLERDSTGQQPPPWDPEKEGGWGEMGEGTGQCGLVTGAPGANQFPKRYANAAALHQLHRWIRTGKAADHHPLFGFSARTRMVRDADGNVTGGMRLPQIQVPVAEYNGRCPDTLQGFTRSFPDADLFARYPTFADYRSKMVAATRLAILAETVRPCDAVDIYRRVERAAARWPESVRSAPEPNPFSCDPRPPRRCVSVITIRIPKGARVKANAGRVKVRGRRARIDLRGVKRRTVVVKVRYRRDGRQRVKVLRFTPCRTAT